VAALPRHHVAPAAAPDPTWRAAAWIRPAAPRPGSAERPRRRRVGAADESRPVGQAPTRLRARPGSAGTGRWVRRREGRLTAGAVVLALRGCVLPRLDVM